MNPQDLSYSQNKKIYWLILISSLVRMLMATFPLSNGEAYYARGTLELQLSYFDQPPLFLWISGLFVKVFGYNPLVLRFSSIIFFAGITLLIYHITRRIYNNQQAGFLAALFINISAVFSISIGAFFQPDSPLHFFWLLSFYFILDIFFYSEEVPKKKLFLKFIYLGITLGLTALSKYHIVFLVFGVFLFLLFSSSHRKWLTHYGPYLSLLITLIFFLPVLVWNYQNDWISFTFQSSRAGASESSLRFDWLIRSIGGQALWVLPWIWIPLIYQLWRLIKVKDNEMIHRLIFWTALPVIVFFTIVTLWSDLQFHFHWQAPGYMMLFIPLGYWLAHKQGTYSKIMNFLNIATVVVCCLSFILLGIHVHTGFWQLYGPKWLAQQFDNHNDPTIYFNEYKAVKQTFEKHGWLKDDNIFAGCPRWWFAGLADFSLRGQKDFLIFSGDTRNYTYLSHPERLLGKDCIIVIPGYKVNIKNDVAPFFDKIEHIDSCWIERFEGERELQVDFYYCENFKTPYHSVRNLPIYAQMHGLAPFSLILDESEEEDTWQRTYEEGVIKAYSGFEYNNPYLRPKRVNAKEKNNGDFSCLMDKESPFSVLFEEKITSVSKVDVKFMAKSPCMSKTTCALQVVDIQTGKDVLWSEIAINDSLSPKNTWSEVNISFNVKGLEKGKEYVLKSFFWKIEPINKEDIFWLDDVHYTIYK